MKWLSVIILLLAFNGSAMAETPELSTEITRTPAGETVLHLSFLTTASPEKLWRSLTATDELAKWVAPAVRVELKLGGFYEYYYNPKRSAGKRGMEGNRILAYIPGKMLTHSGSMPDTWVVWTIEPAGDQQVLHYYAVGTSADWSDTASARMTGLIELVEKLAKYVQP